MQDGDSKLVITCDACGANDSREIDWLQANAVLTCTGCGHDIDLGRDPWRGAIQRLWNASHHLGPIRRRLP